MPCFPPSYKRKKGDAEGECGDYTDPLQIIQGFTNTGEVQELSRNGEVCSLRTDFTHDVIV